MSRSLQDTNFLMDIHFRKGFISIWLATLYLAIFYWGFLASDRYVSESYLVLESTDLSSSNANLDMQGLISGNGQNRADQIMLVNYLNSIDMLKVLDNKFDLYKHYQKPEIDAYSRLWHDKSDGVENLKEYLEDFIDIHYDDYLQTIVIRVGAFSPEIAQQINKTLITKGEEYINHLDHELASVQVDFLSNELKKIKTKSINARNKLLEYKRGGEDKDQLFRLQMESEFLNEIYKSALASMENSRIEASRTIKKLSILQSANLPEYSTEPRRIYNIIVYALLSAMIFSLIHFVRAILKDYRD